MMNRPTTRSQTAIKPFRLLDLPRELLVPIVRSYRQRITATVLGLPIYDGEEYGNARYSILLALCLTHRDILPIAQEELFKRLDIKSNGQMDLLNRSIIESQRCKEYAGRTESIEFDYLVHMDKFMASGVFNPRELSSSSKGVKFSDLNQFTNLRRFNIREAKHDVALSLDNLESYDVKISEAYQSSIDASLAFKSEHLPNLRRLSIACNSRRLLSRQIYDSVIPQLDHLALTRLHETDFEHLLGLSTSLQSLDIGICDVGTSGVFSKVLDHLARIDVKELHYSHNIWFNKMDNWEKDFESMAELKKVVEGKDHLELVKFDFVFGYYWNSTTDISDRALANWKGIKAELESICVERGIEVVGLNCCLNCGDSEHWRD